MPTSTHQKRRALLVGATDKQAKMIEMLPATSDEIAEELDCTRDAARNLIRRVRERHGNRAIRRHDDGKYRIGLGERPMQLTTSEKRTISADLRETLTEMDREWQERLNNAPVLEARPVTYPSNEDVIVHCTDDHFGDKEIGYDPLTGEEGIVYDTSIAVERAETRAQRAIDLAAIQSEVCEYDTVHYLMGGDMVTGDGGIYDHQAWDVEASLREQIRTGAEVHLRCIRSLAESGMFKHVQVVTVPGNHGEIRVKGSSPDTNGDEILYDMVEFGLATSGLDNVSVLRSHNDHADFATRGGNHWGRLYHGHTVPKHASTNAMKGRWFPKLVRDPATGEMVDVVYSGHYHTHKIEDLYGRKLVWSGSLKPPTDFAEKIGAFSYPCAFIHGASNKFPMTWQYPIYWY